MPGERFNLLLVDENEVREQMRFYRDDIIDIVIALRLPDVIVTQSGDKIWSVEALCLVLYRLSSPSKLSRMSSVFHRSLAAISRIINYTLFWIMEHWHKVLEWDAHRLTPAKLEECAQWCSLRTRGLGHNVFGFIDGTCRPICKPSVGQEGQYNSRKKQHTLNYQGVVATDGILIHLSEAFDGTHNDIEMFNLTGMDRLLEEHAYDTQRRPLAIFGDSAYQPGAHVIVKYDECPAMPDHEAQYNIAMNAQRTSIEWAFGEITRYFNALNYRRQQQLLKSPVEYHYRTMAIMTNIRTCIYGNQISSHFRSVPPTLSEYLNDVVFTPI